MTKLRSYKLYFIVITVVSVILYISQILNNHGVGLLIIGQYSKYHLPSSDTKEHGVCQEELDFPLAYSIMAYQDFDRMLRLLKAIYRSHNCYCVHIDAKVGRELRDKVTRVINRNFGRNVDVVPLRHSLLVSWGEISLVDADLLCSFRLLTVCPAKWKYWINLTGHEFPLRTNWEMVTALSLFNGTNLIAGSFLNRFEERLPKWSRSTFKFTWHYGSCHIAATRRFVEFLHRDNRSREVLNILRDWEVKSPLLKTIPDETYFATMNHNPATIRAPGAFTGVHEMNAAALVTRYKRWMLPDAVCGSGHWIRGLCMFGVNDFRVLQRSPQLFANKFIPSVEPEAYDMMEEWLNFKVRFENMNNELHSSFNAKYYLSLNMSRHHL